MKQKIYEVNEIKEKLYKVFEAAPVYCAILFGSYAKSSATDQSDVDIAVDSKGELLNISFYSLLEDIITQQRYGFIRNVSIQQE